MRVLVVGAGATGGYFGGRLAELGRDVTFLVRPRRAAQLAAGGLRIRSAQGDYHLASPKILLSGAPSTPFDLVLLSCKAYDLAGAIESFAPAIGADTRILPLLNGMRHLDLLEARFGAGRVLGGQCVIAATLDDDGSIVHLNNAHGIAFGDRCDGTSSCVQKIAEFLHGANFDSRLSENIVQDMWEKWVFLATLAAATCLMRAPIGAILKAPAGPALIHALFGQCKDIATRNAHAPRDQAVAQALKTLTQADSTLTASMLRDIERQAPIEADHVIGDLIARSANAAGDAAVLSPLQTAYAHLKAYENRRAVALSAS